MSWRSEASLSSGDTGDSEDQGEEEMASEVERTGFVVFIALVCFFGLAV
ncbi:MAG: hypothetical protein DVB28_001128 [Verrucomicrobia bacterium]|nr:MAG: hypothetical protein DVB28_001128 [Verrucomicrobiota bacterium]